MAFAPTLETGEEVQHDINVVISGKLAMRLVLTNRAAYWPGSKFAVSDGVTTERLGLDRVRSVAIGKRSQGASLVVGVLLVIAGIAWTLAGFVGAPQALVVGGLIVAVVGGRRRVVRIQGESSKFAWSEPIAFGGGVKAQVGKALEAVAAWARDHGLRVEV